MKIQLVELALLWNYYFIIFQVIGEALTFANDVIRGKLTGAQKENEFVYHEKIPPFSSLPEVKGASLVKGISFSFTDPEVAGPDIFSRLVPIEAHQASSLYRYYHINFYYNSNYEIGMKTMK